MSVRKHIESLNINQEVHLPDVEKPGNLIYPGLRVYDIKDPLLPTETGWFIPPQPSEQAGPLPRTWTVLSVRPKTY